MIPTQALQPRNNITLLKLLKTNNTFRLLLFLLIINNPTILLGRAPHHHSRAAACVAAPAHRLLAARDAANTHLHVALAQLFAAADRVDGREGKCADWTVVCFTESW